jgi:hypothetical protein
MPSPRFPSWVKVGTAFPARSPAAAKSLYFPSRREPGQPALLEPAHATTGDVQVPDDLLDRRRLIVRGDTVAKLEHASFAFRELVHRPAERRSFEAELDFLWWPWLIRHHEFPQCALLISGRFVKTRYCSSCFPHLGDLLDGEANCGGDLLRSRISMKRSGELYFGHADRMLPLNEVDR